jgi:hypothetical protein
MKKFLAIFTGTPEARGKAGWDSMDETKRKELEKKGIAAWGEWMQTHHSSVVETGGPVGKTKRIGPGGITDIRNNIAGYVVVQAESHQAAAQLFIHHPHFAIFPGDAVEVMECLPIPGQ